MPDYSPVELEFNQTNETAGYLVDSDLRSSAETLLRSKLSSEIEASRIKGLGRFLPVVSFDLLSLVVVLLATYEWIHAKLWNGWIETAYYISDNIERTGFYAALVILVLVLFRWNSLYEHQVIQTRVEQFFCILRSFLLADVVVIVVSFIFFTDTLSDSFKQFLFWFTLFGTVITFTGRLIFRYVIKGNLWLSTLKQPKRIIIIGAGQAGRLYAAFLKQKLTDLDVVFYDDDAKKIGTKIFDFIVQGKPEDVIYKAMDKQVDEICIVIENIKKRRLLEIIQVAKKTGLPVKVWSSHYNLMFTGMYERSKHILPPIPLSHSSNQRIDLVIKRIIDILIVSLALVIFFVPVLVIALLIKATSSGPIFHISYRVGLDGKLFKMYKFRTMTVDTEEKHQKVAIERLKEGQHMGKVIADPRITRIGHFLRRFSLDELPQLFNVLIGNMSLVGPRPCFEYEMDFFEEWHHRRFTMKPGITGLWQVTGRQMDDLRLDDAMTTDVYYTDNFYLWMDFRILFRTVPVVFSGNGK